MKRASDPGLRQRLDEGQQQGTTLARAMAVALWADPPIWEKSSCTQGRLPPMSLASASSRYPVWQSCPPRRMPAVRARLLASPTVRGAVPTTSAARAIVEAAPASAAWRARQETRTTPPVGTTTIAARITVQATLSAAAFRVDLPGAASISTAAAAPVTAASVLEPPLDTARASTWMGRKCRYIAAGPGHAADVGTKIDYVWMMKRLLARSAE